MDWNQVIKNETTAVHGRNLIDGSDNLKDWKWWSTNGQSAIDYTDDYAMINVTTPSTGWQYTCYEMHSSSVIERLKPNTDYTLSFKCEGEINGCQVSIRCGNSSDPITNTVSINITNGIASAILHTLDSIKPNNQIIYINLILYIFWQLS